MSQNPYLHERAYYFNEATDAYVFNLTGVAKPLVLPGTVVRDMVKGYSNLGEGGSVNEIARANNLPRGWVTQVLRHLSVTHDGLPFTAEELATRPSADLEAEGLALKGANLWRSLERQSWSRIQEDALRWRNLETSILRRFPDAPNPAPTRLQIPQSKRRFAVVLSPTDFHWGKWAATEEGAQPYNRAVAARRLKEATEQCLANILPHGAPEEILVGVGSDFFHVDNEAGTTSGGTPQDRDGNPLDIIQSGCELMVQYVDHLRTVAPVKLILMAGNHDHLLGYCLLLYLAAHYRQAPDVTVVLSAAPRQYTSYGETLLAFVHGDAVARTQDIARLASIEAKSLWGATNHRVALTGHLHYEKMEDDRGFVRYQMPSLSGTDRWHMRHGYVGSRVALSAILIDHQAGVFGTLLSSESPPNIKAPMPEKSPYRWVSQDLEGRQEYWTPQAAKAARLDTDSINRVIRGKRLTYNNRTWRSCGEWEAL